MAEAGAGASRPEAGVLVGSTAHGLATILPDNVFLNNAGGDVVRAPPPPPLPWEV